MEEERISGNLPRSPSGTGHDIEGLEKRLADAFVVLGLLSDDDNPMSPDQAIAHARREAESFRLWEESDAPIGGVALRLGDGEQVALVKGGRQSIAAVCSIKEYRPGAVLHVLKTEDDHFGEVKLYSVRLSDIPTTGFPYTRKYRNKQALMLNFEHGPSGQLDVSVDYTPAQGEDITRASVRSYGLVAAAAFAALLAYRLVLGLWRKAGLVGGVAWEPNLAVVTYVLVAGLSTTFITSSWGVSSPRHETEEARAGAPVVVSTYRPEATAFSPGKADKNAGGCACRLPLTNTVTVTLPRDQGWALLYFNHTTALYTLSDTTPGNTPELNRMVCALDSLTGDNFPSGFPNAALALRTNSTFMASGPAFAGIDEGHLGQAVLAQFDGGEQADYSFSNSFTNFKLGQGPGLSSTGPEPMTMFLLGIGLAGMLARVRRRKR